MELETSNDTRVTINTYVPEYQRDLWKQHAELLDMNLSEFVRAMVQAGRRDFDIGIKNMGGNVIELNPNSIGFGTRESYSDIVKVLSQYLDCLVIRNDDHEKIKSIVKFDYIPIINGLSNYSHPCQILSDVFTIEEKMGPISNLLIVWCGDINNVLISLMQASIIFNFNLNIASPKIIMRRNQDIFNFYIENLIHNIIAYIFTVKVIKIFILTISGYSFSMFMIIFKIIKFF